MTKRLSWSRLLALLATGTILAAGCGDDDDSDAAASDSDSGSGEEAAECPERRLGADGDALRGEPAGRGELAPRASRWPWPRSTRPAASSAARSSSTPQDTQADPDVSRQVVADQVEDDPFVFLGTVFSSNTIVNMVEAQRAEIPMFVGAEAPAITDREENGDNDYIYRASFGVDTAADKFVSYMVDEGVESVDVIYKNDEFGAGGRDAYVAAFDEAGIDVGLDIQVQPDQVDQSAEVTQLAGGDADAIFVFMTEIETAAFLDEYQAQGLDKPLYGGDVLSAASTIALAQPGAADGTTTHAGLNASAPVFSDWKDGLRRVPSRRRPARSQQHQGLHDRPRGQGGRRADRRVRQHASSRTRCTAPRSRSRTSPACCSTSATTATATSTARATSCRSSTAPVRSSRPFLRSTTSTSGVARHRGSGRVARPRMPGASHPLTSGECGTQR